MNLDIFRRLNESGDWKEVCVELDARVIASEKKLRDCRPEELVILQERIRAFEELKLLPSQVLDREEE
jgi:hypothetical protein